MSDARSVRDLGKQRLLSAAAMSAYEVTQSPTGEAGVYDNAVASSTDSYVTLTTRGTYACTKTAGVVILKGGRVYWDHSANACTYKRVNDRDFYVGRATQDASSAQTYVEVDLNADPPYDIDIHRDACLSTLVGTAAAGGLSYPVRLGGCSIFELTATNEAQKNDLLSVDGFAEAANAIIEGAFRVISDGAGAEPDFNIGVANASHASDADAITESVFIHLDGNSTTIYAESDDGTVEVAATDTTLTYTEGSAVANRVEFWMDFRDPASVKIYINGAAVLTATVFDVDDATGPWFLLAHLEKSAATSVYKIAIDWLRVRFAEQ